MNRDIVLAIDLGGTNLRMAAVNRAGEILYRTKNRTPRSDSGAAIIDLVVRLGDECRQALPDENVVAYATAVPGTIDFENGIIQKAPNLPELDGLKMAEEVRRRTGVEAILENDANAAAIGEKWLGASKGYENSVMVTLGTGVGGGIFINGAMIRGADGTAGEIGHINIEPEGLPCGCGSRGCVEQYGSATAVVRMAKESVREGRRSALDSIEEITAEEVYNAAEQGDEVAMDIFRRQGYYLGIMLAGLLNSINPEAIVIGGGASGAWKFFAPHLRSEIVARSYKEPAERVKIMRSILGDDAGILGGVKLGFMQSSKLPEAAGIKR